MWVRSHTSYAEVCVKPKLETCFVFNIWIMFIIHKTFLINIVEKGLKNRFWSHFCFGKNLFISLKDKNLMHAVFILNQNSKQ